MSASIHFLHAPSKAAAFLRVGYTDHSRLEALMAKGQLQFERLGFNASFEAHQRDFFRRFINAGNEAILDLNFAELGTMGKFGSAAKALPWSLPGRPWTPSDLTPARSVEVAKQMAGFVAARRPCAVLAPCHLLESASDGWVSKDIQLFADLREEMDKAGNQHIPIDYQLILPFALFCDPLFLTELIEKLRPLRMGAIWLRVGNFGVDASANKLRKYIESARILHALNVPLVSDHNGGFAALGAFAFGATSGLSHGLDNKERFDLSPWRNPASDSGGGCGLRVYLPQLDYHLLRPQAVEFFAVKGAKPRFGCNETQCCPQGIADMLDDPTSHFLNQRSKQVDELSGIPEAKRPAHFLREMLQPSILSARYAVRIGASLAFAEKLNRALRRLEDMFEVLHDLDKSGVPSSAASLKVRSNTATPSATWKR